MSLLVWIIFKEACDVEREESGKGIRFSRDLCVKMMMIFNVYVFIGLVFSLFYQFFLICSIEESIIFCRLECLVLKQLQ